jgi:hypothetical protein
MKTLQELLLEVVACTSNGEFYKAVRRAGLSDEEVKEIIDAVYESGE